MRRLSTINLLIGLGMLTPGLVPGASIAAQPAALASASEDLERAEASRITSIRLPEGAYRPTNERDLSKFADSLKTIAQTNQGKMTKTEVLIWQGGDAKEAIKDLPTRLKAAGYNYVPGAGFDAEPGRITPFGAAIKGKSASLLGMWVETKNEAENYVLLVWGVCQTDKAEQPTLELEASQAPAAPEPVSPKKASASASGKTPADLLGKWSWTTISSMGYRNTVTNQLSAPSGMSAKFTFTPDGRYDYFFYVRQQTYNLVTESTSTHQGRVTFNGDGTFTLYPAKGYYKGHTGGSKVVDRPMTEAERQKPVNFTYEWRTEDGKRQLYIGPSKSSLSKFKSGE